MANDKLNEMYGNGNLEDAAYRAVIAERNRAAAKLREEELYKAHAEEKRLLKEKQQKEKAAEVAELDQMTYKSNQNKKQVYGDKKREYTSRNAYSKMKNVYQDRAEVVGSELTRKPKKRKIRKDRVAIVGAIGAVAVLGMGAVIHNLKSDRLIDDSEGDNSEPTTVTRQFTIDYDWTNMYSQAPEYNKLETLYYGDIVKYDPAGIGYYNEENGIVAKVTSVEAKNPQTKWNTCYDDENNIKGFVPDEYVDKYVAYTLNPQYEKAFYRTNSSLDNPDEKITTGTIVYVKDDSPIINQDSIHLYPMIIINQNEQQSAIENGINDIAVTPRYITGYIELGKLEKALDAENIGCISAQRTFLRKTPFVTELDESLIIGQIKKDEIINVVGEVQQGPETWYKYVSTDNKNGKDAVFYVASYATKPIKEKEIIDESSDSKLDDDKNTNEKDKLTYLMDISSYNTFDSFKFHVDDLIAHNCMGGVIMEIGKTMQKAEFTQKCMYENDINSSEGNGVSSSKKLQDYYNEINTHFAPGQNEKNGKFVDLNDIEKYISYLVSKDVPVGFYYYSCAINPNEASAEAAYIYAIENKFYHDIPELKNAKVLPIAIDIEDADYASSTMSKQKFLEKFPNKTDSDFAYYTKYTNRNGEKDGRAEAVALITQLLGNGTNNPGCWSIDGVNPKNGYGLLPDNQIIIYSGTNQTAFKNENSKQSLYINSLEDLTARVSDYNVVEWQTRHVYFQKDSENAGKTKKYDNNGKFTGYERFEYTDDRIQHDLLEYGMVDTINNNGYYCIEHAQENQKYACKNAAAGDIMQVALDINGDVKGGKTQCIDFSLTNQYTVDAILDGTYTHTENFVDKINRVYELQMENSEYSIDDMYLEEIEH